MTPALIMAAVLLAQPAADEAARPGRTPATRDVRADARTLVEFEQLVRSLHWACTQQWVGAEVRCQLGWTVEGGVAQLRGELTACHERREAAACGRAADLITYMRTISWREAPLR